MAPKPFNQTFLNQNKKLIRASFKKAVISAVNISAFTADVYFAENPGVVIKSIPLASQIDPTKILIGDRCRVDVFDETNQRDMVIAYIYGRNMTIKDVVFNSGTGNFFNPTSFPQYVNHGILVNGVATTPDIYWIGNSNPAWDGSRDNILIPEGISTTQIKVDCYKSPIGITIGYYWFAIKFLYPA